MCERHTTTVHAAQLNRHEGEANEEPVSRRPQRLRQDKDPRRLGGEDCGALQAAGGRGGRVPHRAREDKGPEGGDRQLGRNQGRETGESMQLSCSVHWGTLARCKNFGRTLSNSQPRTFGNSLAKHKHTT